MAKLVLAVPRRFAAKEELIRLLGEGDADLYLFPEGFLRNEDELSLALELSGQIEGTIITGCQRGGRELALILEGGRVADQYAKCVLTAGERETGKRPGERIRCLNTQWGRLAVPICYELHFPEVCRIMALEAPVLMVNIIGTGMYHRLQYEQWRALARARAIENETPVAGCCHFCGEIPLAFAFGGDGEPLLEKAGVRGAFSVEVDLGPQRPIGYFADRRPELFVPLCKEE